MCEERYVGKSVILELKGWISVYLSVNGGAS